MLRNKFLNKLDLSPFGQITLDALFTETLIHFVSTRYPLNVITTPVSMGMTLQKFKVHFSHFPTLAIYNTIRVT